MKKIFTAKKCILLILCFVFATMLFSCASMKEYTATFVADGVTVSTETFKTEDTSITVPTVPAKDGYTAKWESYTLSANDIVIHAEYTPITYTATFEVDDVVFGYDVFTMDNKTVTLPDVPNKEGYTGTWENYTLTASDIVIGAVYTPITYTATFVVDGETIGTDTFTVEDLTVTPPAIPSKDGYTSVWEGYTLTASDITIAPQYTPVIYTATFVANGDKVGKTTFTVEDLSIECPSVPNKDGYTGAWEAYTITASDTVIEAEYTPIIYTATFVVGGSVIATEKFTLDNPKIVEPPVPFKDGYRGAWESYTLSAEDIEIHPVYTPIDYTATFMADGVLVGKVGFNLKDLTLDAPAVPKKAGYAGVWETYTLTTCDIIIEAEYTPIIYTATFVADGVIVGSDTFTVEDSTLSMPPVPQIEGYIDGRWESYTLKARDMTINAEYTAIVYTATFIAEGETVGTVDFTMDSLRLIEPAMPFKDGYDGVWENYVLAPEDMEIQAEYTLTQYLATFKANGVTVGTDTFTIEDLTITEPAVPSKVGYTNGKWESYTLAHRDITIYAEYTAIVYTATFIAHGVTVGTATFTMDNPDVEEPPIPHEVGYTGEWNNYRLSASNITIYAEYTLTGPFEVKFIDPLAVDNPATEEDETVIAIRIVQKGRKAKEPVFPERTGYKYTGWDSEDWKVSGVFDNMTVTATYENLGIHTVTYKDADGNILGRCYAYDEEGIMDYKDFAGVPLPPSEYGKYFAEWVNEDDTKDASTEYVIMDMVLIPSYKNTTTTAPLVEAGSITVDGVKDDMYNVKGLKTVKSEDGEIDVIVPTNAFKLGYVTPNPQSGKHPIWHTYKLESTVQATAYVVWDGEWVYVCVEVTDETPGCRSEAYVNGSSNPYFNDCVELLYNFERSFSPSRSTQKVGIDSKGIRKMTDFSRYASPYASSGGAMSAWYDDIEAAAVPDFDNNKYVVEFKIPAKTDATRNVGTADEPIWEGGIDLEVGDAIRMQLQVNDLQEFGAESPDGQLIGGQGAYEGKFSPQCENQYLLALYEAITLGDVES